MPTVAAGVCVKARGRLHFIDAVAGWLGMDGAALEAALAVRSPNHFLREVATYMPTWVVAAANDPVLPWKPVKALGRNPGKVHLVVEERGGHAGFLGVCPSFVAGQVAAWLASDE